MKDYRLYHSSSNGATLNFFEAALPSNGAMISNTEKERIGVPISGMSPKDDVKTGGASYTFTRISKGFSNSGIYFKLGNVRRLDSVSYYSDHFGNVMGNNAAKWRSSATIQRLKENAGNYNNETNFKGNLGLLSELDAIKTTSKTETNAIIQVFKK